MRINHNLMAMNTHRQLGINSDNTSKALEKLSSGLRINRAGDDAAGLAISEKMRGQIRGLNQASRNSQDGISMIQTAEGALNETHDILQRLRELAVQSANDSNNAVDRSAIQKEVEQLKSEVDRIGNTTEFNTQKLIDGSIGAKKAPGVDNAAVLTSGLGASTAGKYTGTVDFNEGALKIADATNAIDSVTQNITVDGAKIDFKVTQSGLQATAGDTTGAAFATYLQNQINEGIEAYNQKYNADIAKVSVTAAGGAGAAKISIESGSTGATSSIATTVATTAANNLWEIAGFDVSAAATLSNAGLDGKFTTAGAANWSAISNTDTSTVTIDGKAIQVTWSNVGGQAALNTDDMTGANFATKVQTDINNAITAYNATVPTADKVDSVKVSVQDGSFVIQSGSSKTTSSIKFDNSEAAKLLGVAGQNSAVQGGGVDFQIGANQTQTMKVTIADMRAAALGIDKIDLSTKEGAQAAITVIENASKTVSGQRADLGAFQNRLEHTIKNLDTSSENLQAAESRIRDVDMAKEMMNFTKNNILQQAAQAMLAQANQAPQGVLQLLR